MTISEIRDNSMDASDIMFMIGVILVVFQLTSQNIFWTGVILIIISIFWGSAITVYNKNKIKKVFK
jgi:hypothetical protein